MVFITCFSNPLISVLKYSKVIKMNNIKQKLQRFMQGRYGIDILSRDLSYLSLGLFVLNLFVRNTWLYAIALILLLISYLRMFSKKYTKRYNENRVYANLTNNMRKKIKRFFTRIKDFPKYKYIRCTHCNKQLRLPRGKKEIVVTCPVCRQKFDAKT